jgi:bacteriorhodopsin
VGVVILWAVVAAAGIVGVVVSFRAGLRAEPNKRKVAACLVALVLSLGVAIFGMAMIANTEGGPVLI